jgi:L-fucose isomerase
MLKPKVGLITFGDNRENEWNKVFQAVTEPRHAKAAAALRAMPIELVTADEVARSREDINTQVDALKAAGVDLFVAHTPAWTSPNLVVHGVQRMGIYTVVLGNRDAGTHGSVGLFGASGALKQIGYDHRTIRVNYDDPGLADRLLPVFRAGMVKNRLKGSVFGYFGGRSIGIDTSQFDAMQWRKEFGVDAEHIDQIEIVRVAETIDQARVDKMRTWIVDNAKEVIWDDEKLTKEKFDFQIACYLATKDICKERGLEFTAVKCMPELSVHYVPQCMTAAFLPDLYDGEEGEKEGIVMACEADADGALTQQILKLLSGGKPTFFADTSHIDNDRESLYCVNCGAMCAWYAGRADKPEDNLAKITIKKSVRPGGAGITFFFAAPGPMQLARLYREDGRYKMAIMPTKAYEPTQEMVDEFIEARGPHQLPTMFVDMKFDIDRFVDEYGSNHISGVAGNYKEELLEVCRMLDIEPVVFE